jgi:glycosyltransferase involved in cell wall biosynthesis
VSNCVQPPAVLNPEERLAIRRELGLSVDDFVILAVGRLSRQKGFDILLEAFARAVDSMDSARLLIIGEGEDRAALTNTISRSGRGGQITLMGARSDIDHLLGAADLFVLPSRWEGLPLALLEALAAGLPIIATNVGDVLWATGRDGAVLIPPEDASALAAAICSLAGDAECRLSLRHAAQRSATRFTDPSAYINTLIQVYYEVLRRT